MTINRFISYSLIIHLLSMTILFISIPKKEYSGAPFFARLVTPDEIGADSEGAARPKSSMTPKTVSPSSKVGKAERPYVLEDNSSNVSQSKENGSIVIPEGKGIQPGTGSLSSPLKKENLFDKDIIKRFAKEGEEEKSSVTLYAKEFKYYGYMQRLREKIENIWQYPVDAAARGIYGDLLINFTITKDGSLGSVELVRTSGYRNLDEAAMKALKDAAPYWPLPDDWKQDGLTITGHFIYTIYGIYVR